MDNSELAWAVGLFEGEGCITHNGKKHGAGFDVVLVLCTTDLDVIERFREAVGVGTLHLRYTKAKTYHKTIYEWRLACRRRVIPVLVRMWPWLCQRRRARARELLAAWNYELPA